MSTVGKLTKKQKKTLAFRERKTGKRKDHDASVMDDEDGNVPAMEDQNMADTYDDPLEVQMEKSKNGVSSLENKKGKAKAKFADEPVVEKSKKRQREEETTTQAKHEAKRAKVSDDSQATGQIAEAKAAKTQRFILFVGMSPSIVTFSFV
jgi:nucleolar protein 6